jgi:hypothetical protein
MHEHATLIQKSICPDSIVSNSNSTVPFRRLLQHYRPDSDIGPNLPTADGCKGITMLTYITIRHRAVTVLRGYESAG